MCWLCDHPERSRDDYLDLLRSKIARYGYALQYVEHATRPFAYTIGLHARGLPEFLVTGLQPQHAARLLRMSIAHLAEAEPVPGRRYPLPGSARVEIVAVDNPFAHMGFAITLEGWGISALQVVWADRRGRWPWAPGFADGRHIQPVLGRRAAQPGEPNA